MEESDTYAAFKPKQKISLALVLGGGGARGLAHLGAIHELEAAGIRPDLIVGCSAGSIVGAFYADDPRIERMEKILLKLKRGDMMDLSLSSRYGFVQGKSLQKFMKKNLSAQTFSALQIPLIVVATDLLSGETVEISHEQIAAAVSASCAVPGVFKPQLLKGRYLVDGGVTSPLPVAVAKKYGAQLVVAIDVSERLATAKPSHLLGVAKRGAEIAYRKLIEHELAQADISVQMEFDNVGMFDDEHNDQLYEWGRLKAREKIPEIKKMLASRR